MNLIVRNYCTKTKYNNVKIFKNKNVRTVKQQKAVVFKELPKSSEAKPCVAERTEGSDVTATVGEFVENVNKVQMISRNLHSQIFDTNSAKHINAKTEEILTELKNHGIDIENNERIQDVSLTLPKLRGNNIEEHFHSIAKEQVAEYQQQLEKLTKCNQLPKCPEKWQLRAGWTAYDAFTGKAEAINHPDANAVVFDVEVCMSSGASPTLATAVSTDHWYAWVSPKLMQLNKSMSTAVEDGVTQHAIDELIPFGKNCTKLVVGHNVSYDRARIQEQYFLENNDMRFMDTMSMHVCVSGMTSYQRLMLKSKKPLSAVDADWQSKSSLNSLAEVHKLYCKTVIHSKETRNVFVEGTLENVLADFQTLMTYCANDVQATWRVLKALYPLFKTRFPHPASLAGMLEMGSTYLPVNSKWLRYVNESNLAFEDLNIEANYHLARRADEACAYLNDELYRKHLWLWDEDWSVQQLKLKATSNKKKAQLKTQCEDNNKFLHLYATKVLLPARRPLLPGYPAWYRKLCEKPPQDLEVIEKSDDTTSYWTPGPSQIRTGMQIAPKLLSLCYEGYPLHYMADNGWGYIIPFCNPSEQNPKVPIDALIAMCPIPETVNKQISKAPKDVATEPNNSSKIILEDCCYFVKLPHKNGNAFRVGNPLARDFLNKFVENVLSSHYLERESSAKRIIEIARMVSYWRNNRKRIMSQMVVWLPSDYLPTNDHESNLKFGAICPQIVTCGTLTRRAMEPTWLTASNSHRERIGSELRAMVQAPPGYKIVGADVDSQELWIASLLGDAYAFGEHGATPLGWMTLSGIKARGTDMHSKTAQDVGISRDHAKVINYARIYGAGQKFAEGLLQQFNPKLSTIEAKRKAEKMFSSTKGKRSYRLLKEFWEQLEDREYSHYEAMKLAKAHSRSVYDMFERSRWKGGTESAMFNCLENIALESKPVTPFLNCRLSRALETSLGDESRFLPTRINWVVQSGAVDFLHLMLVSMRWLMGEHVRFCISFHDEVRYLVKDEYAYKAALAMHVTNLLTRAFFSHRLGLNNLPMSVAFFGSVEVDKVLRKESTMNCETPSNPHGLQIGYGIPNGKSLTVYEAIEKAGGSDLTKWNWVK